MPNLRANTEGDNTDVNTSSFVRANGQVGSDIRVEKFNGEDHLVVPIVALVEGVIQGALADHPELALAEEFGKMVGGWNGRPVTLDHPKENGQFVSASASPQVFEREALGFLFNSKIVDKKLVVEAWINLNKVNNASEETKKQISKVQNKEVVEVSTGLFTLVENSTGRFNNEDYKGVWRNVVPDHLAILAEGVKGACSVKDGCGTNRNNLDSANCDCQDNKDGKDASKKKMGAYKKGSFMDKIIGLFQESGINVSEDGTMTSETISDQRPNNEEKDMKKEELINSLITNSATRFEEKDREWLATLSEAQLEKLAPQEKTQAEKDAEAKANKDKADKEEQDRANAKAAKKPATATEYVNAAPAEIQEVLNEALGLQQARRAELIKGLKANKQNEFSEEELKAMNTKQLERLAKLANVPTYEGRAGGTISANADNENDVPAMPAVFERK